MSRIGWRLLAVALVALAGAGLAAFPRWTGVLGVAFAAVFGILLRWPRLWPVVALAAWPLLDLAPWTGRFFLDELDLLLLVVCAARLWSAGAPAAASGVPGRVAALPAHPDGASTARRLSMTAALLLAVSVVTSGLIGLLPLAPLDANAFASYWSPYNSLRVAKGFAWGFVLFLLFRAEPDKGRASDLLTLGMALGLAGVALVATWEQLAFADGGARAYRVTATFSSMHVGGGHIEAYLALAIPFAWAAAWRARAWALKALAIAVFLLASYAVIATVARGGIIALVVVYAVLGIAALRGAAAYGGDGGSGGIERDVRPRALGRAAALGSVVLAVAVVGLGIAKADYLKWRFSRTAQDAQIRLDQWRATLAMMDRDAISAFLGTGLGSFPARYLAHYRDARAGHFRYAQEDGRHFLALNSGGTLYMAQQVTIEPRTPYTVEVDARSDGASRHLEVAVCEKVLFRSRRCRWMGVTVDPVRAWQHRAVRFDSGRLAEGPWWSRRPVQLSLYNPLEATSIDVTGVRLLDPSGRDLLRNGDFAAGGDFWFFKSSDHLAWHPKSLWVQLAFEQGALGVLSFGLLAGLALWRTGRAAWRGQARAVPWLAGLTGMLVVGIFDSLVDAPRLAALLVAFALVGASPGLAANGGAGSAADPARDPA